LEWRLLTLTLNAPPSPTNEPMNERTNTPSSASADDDVLVRVEHVSKKFCRSLKKSLWYGVQDIAAELNPFSKSNELRVTSDADSSASSPVTRHSLPGEAAPSLVTRHPSHSSGLRPEEFWAVNDVSFELRRGECLGLIGRNGAGKTTLLKVLNGLVKPDGGCITMRGRVGALIALGAGFSPILTGRENIYINASVLGLTKKEIGSRIDEIIDFAEIGDFIDAPVQGYSSGMQVRLGFAVATTLNPDVLLLDEVLAVGDAAFRAKCYNRIANLQRNAAVIFVSHAMEQVSRICNRVIILSHGHASYPAKPYEGVQLYERANTVEPDDAEGFLKVAPPVLRAKVSICESMIAWNAPLDIVVELDSERALRGLGVCGLLYAADGSVAVSFSPNANDAINILIGHNKLQIRVSNIPLATGQYRLGLTVHPPNSIAHLIWSYKQYSLSVKSSIPGFSPCRLPAHVRWQSDPQNGIHANNIVTMEQNGRLLTREHL
jgi:lipopolysaccharide transport system ATP-binding protein